MDLGRTEAIIQKNEMIPRENIKAGDRIKAIALMLEESKEVNRFFIKGSPKIYGKIIYSRSARNL